MALLPAVGVGLVASAWPALATYTFPNVFSQIPLHGASHEDKGSVITPQLSTFIQNTLTLENITGLAVAVVPKHGEPEFHTWGYRTEDGDRVTPDTLFHMASVSKAFCATALGLLMDDFSNGANVTALPSGLTELTWHTRLRDLLPKWALMDTWASERANLRDVLSHVSGVPRHDASYGPTDAPQDVVARLRYLRPAFELRERWSYTNVMYMVAAHVVTTYSGRSYASFVEERIFMPLGMTSTTLSPTKAEATGRFTQGWTKEGRRIPPPFDETMAFAMAGPGGIISNAVDVAKWIATWLNEGVHGDQRVFPVEVSSYAHAVASDHPVNAEYSIGGYGMGWLRSSYRGHDVLRHTGALPGFSTIVSFLPSDEIGVTLLANSDSQAEPLMLMWNRIIDSALHLSGTQTSIRSPPQNTTTKRHDARNSTSSLSLETFSGTYTNPGYGSFALCSPSSTSLYCARVQSDFAIVDRAQNSPNPPGDLLAEWPRVWSSHVRAWRRRGLIFDFDLPTLYPSGYGKDATPFEMHHLDTVEAEFVVQDGRVVGFGLSGFVELRARTYEDVRDRAEVWFDRV